MDTKNVNDLRQNLHKILFDMGINPAFKENPAYSSIISEFDNFISTMNLGEKQNYLDINIADRKIFFKCTNYDIEYEFNIFVDPTSPNEFGCRKIEKTNYKNFHQELNRDTITKSCNELWIKLEKDGKIKSSQYSSIISNTNKNPDVCNNITSNTEIYYDECGIMISREYHGFGMGELTRNINAATPSDMLFIPKEANNSYGSWQDKYIYRHLMRRQYLDVAGLIVENKSVNTKFVGSVPLNREHGLRNMYFNDGGYLSKQINIPTLTEDEINVMIEKETNEKVKQGLRYFARNRATYQYDSSTDKSFVYNFLVMEEKNKSI